MAKIYPPVKPLKTTLPITPHEVNAGLRTVIGEFNGRLDRENFPAAGSTAPIETLKLNYECLNKFGFLSATDEVEIVYEGQPVGTMIEVPRSSLNTDKMEILFECVDGALIVEASMTVQSESRDMTGTGTIGSLKRGNQPWSLCVTVNGRVAVESGMSAAYPYTSRHVKQYLAVGAGTHTVTMQLRSGGSGRYRNAVGRTVTSKIGYKVLGRTLMVRNAKR